jgi:hypothetical protein
MRGVSLRECVPLRMARAFLFAGGPACPDAAVLIVINAGLDLV